MPKVATKTKKVLVPIHPLCKWGLHQQINYVWLDNKKSPGDSFDMTCCPRCNRRKFKKVA